MTTLATPTGTCPACGQANLVLELTRLQLQEAAKIAPVLWTYPHQPPDEGPEEKKWDFYASVDNGPSTDAAFVWRYWMVKPFVVFVETKTIGAATYDYWRLK